MTDGEREKKRRQRQRRRELVLAEQAAAIHLCAYCEAQTILVPDSAVYSRSYGGHVWWCQPCKA